MKIRVKDTNGGRWLVPFFKQRFGDLHGLLAHVTLNHAAFAVDAIEHFGQLIGASRVVGEQTFDAQGHVAQAARSVDARAK